MKKALTIAGSDSSAGAGIQADLKTFAAHFVYGVSVITSVTAQNTKGVIAAFDLPKDFVKLQLEAIFTDIDIDAVKIGMLSSKEIIEVVSCRLKYFKARNIVLDPVVFSKNGFKLLKDEAIKTLYDELIPLCKVITPNIPEASLLAEMEIKSIDDIKLACKKILSFGCESVLIKGGHFDSDDVVDILFDGKDFYYFKGKRINTKNTHGTGCTLSSAIAANLALGYDVPYAVEKSKEYIQGAIENSLNIGLGFGPLDHFYLFK
ncbi:hydroxymethylpyrimidine/phosphomethylpyrimidine kinase [Caloramator fervidus]|uniref:Hydroxymethylpyrimidine/phosphomethylpyrimidine kinase n=1 Tax=Caloramator fervidus TaxID=29344 RepID=A0A1H5RT46_9CLOT|nr:bifunctional hydroxymethylpyrimidine kinase/phosphomethylpyrimidine kinase [Caloramator fervidus]SEF41495.1 hydroxymethylpyrimidine/phosphomethylpyrimidine kinase [Caloramator fervidus]